VRQVPVPPDLGQSVLLIVRGVIRLDRRFDGRRRCLRDVHRFANGIQQIAAQLLDTLLCGSLYGLCSPQRVLGTLLRERGPTFGIASRLPLQFSTLFCCFSAPFGFLRASAQVAGKSLKSPEHCIYCRRACALV